MNPQEIGGKGEDLAAGYYAANGYRILDKNFRTRFGEVDLILAKDGYVIFSEVKTRNEKSIAQPREWVDQKKQRRIMATAQEYLRKKKMGEPFVRFDVVEVILSVDASPMIRCIENAFSL